MSIEPIKVVADILQTWMKLKPGQVMLAYQKFNIPTNGLYIVLTNVADQSFIAADTFVVDDGQGGQQEVAQVLCLHEIQIDVMSFGDEARMRRLEILMALKSIYSESQQEENGLQIAQLTMPMTDTSSLEVTKFLSRYTTRIRLTAMTQVTRSDPEYFDTFTAALNTDPKSQAPIPVTPENVPV